MRRTVLVCVPVALVVCACSSTVVGSASPAPTSTVASSTSSSAPDDQGGADDPSDADLGAARDLVDELYLGLSSSTETGLQSYADFLAAHDHPQFAYTGAECLTYLQGLGLTDTYRAAYSPDLAGLAPDPGWQVPDGRYEGLEPEGEIYTVPLTVDEFDDATGYSDSYAATVHAVVLDDEAYFFQPCEP